MNQSPDDAAVDGEVVDDGTAAALPVPMTPAEPIAPVTDYTDGGVPTFDYVRDQIDRRFATSTGATELASDSPPVTSLDDQFTARERAGRDRLEQIRRAMREE
jgi:peptidoglycan hydrolase-like protein with peptidoglycan-binding domain